MIHPCSDIRDEKSLRICAEQSESINHNVFYKDLLLGIRRRPGISLELTFWNGINCAIDRSEVGAKHTILRKVTSSKQWVRNSTFVESFLIDVFRAILNCQVQWNGWYHNLYTRWLSPGEHVKQNKNNNRNNNKSNLYHGESVTKK